MFSGRHEVKVEDDGTIFIDRDGTHFRHILNYLRDGGIKLDALPRNRQVLRELRNEAVFYQLHGLVQQIEKLIWKSLPKVDFWSKSIAMYILYFSEQNALQCISTKSCDLVKSIAIRISEKEEVVAKQNKNRAWCSRLCSSISVWSRSEVLIVVWHVSVLLINLCMFLN